MNGVPRRGVGSSEFGLPKTREFRAFTGYHRKAAIHVLRNGARDVPRVHSGCEGGAPSGVNRGDTGRPAPTQGRFSLRRIDSESERASTPISTRTAKKEGIQFTFSRPYNTNNQAYGEGENWCVVRQLVGYRRYGSREALDLLPKERVGSKVRKTYDLDRTPYQRVLAAPDIPEEKKIEAGGIYDTLSSAGLR
ncbi:MAG: hypothetical protein ACUVX8_18355 [Candidatus Zipacnadales bacterium]